MVFIRSLISIGCLFFLVNCRNEPTPKESLLQLEIRTAPILIVMSPWGEDTLKSWTQEFLHLIKATDSMKWVQTNSTDFPMLHRDLKSTTIKIYRKGELIWGDSEFKPKNLNHSLEIIQQKLLLIKEPPTRN